MKCRRCKGKISKADKYCSQCGERIHRNGKLILLGVCVELGFAVMFLGLMFHAGIFPGRPESQDSFFLLKEDLSEEKIVDESSARNAVNAAAELLGMENAEEELGECRTDQAFSSTFYRFEQEYEGIVVYGRSLILEVSENGEQRGLTGNYKNLGEINLDCRIDEEKAANIIEKIYGKNTDQRNEGMVIYSLFDILPEAAWRIRVQGDGVLEDCFVSVQTGKMLAKNSLIYTESVVGRGRDIDGERQTFLTERYKFTGYRLEDTVRNIRVYDAGNAEMAKEFYVVDELDNEYHIENGTWTDPDGHAVRIRTGKTSEYLEIYTESGTLISDKGRVQIKPYIISEDGKREYLSAVSNEDTDWKLEKAVTAMHRAERVYDFFYEVLNRQGFNGRNGETKVVFDDKMSADTGSANAYSTGGDTGQTTLLALGKDNSMSANVIGHEYTHSVEQSISNLQYQGESGALMEAYADIFGELFEDWCRDGTMDGDCDWVHNRGFHYERDMKNPERMNLPAIYGGEFWVDPNQEEDLGGVHTNCMVISHAAYLMCTEYKWPAYVQTLNTGELAELLYRTLFKLPSDCSFVEFRQLVEHTAAVMNKEGKLTGRKADMAAYAFARTGFAEEYQFISEVSEDCGLYIYDINGKLYDNYNVSMYESTDDKSTIWMLNTLINQKRYTVQEAMGICLPLENGKYYHLTVSDGHDANNRTSFTLHVVEDAKDEMHLYTTWGEYESKSAYDTYMEAVEETVCSGSWKENMDMEIHMVVTNGDESVEADASLISESLISGYQRGDTSDVSIKSEVSLNVTGMEEYAWASSYENGKVHYLYKKPYISSKDAETDPNFLDLIKMTEDMILEQSINGKKIYFKISGTKASEIGLTVEDVISGVDDLEYGDINYEIWVDKVTGRLDRMCISFGASLTYRGYSAEADYKIEYTFADYELPVSSLEKATADGREQWIL